MKKDDFVIPAITFLIISGSIMVYHTIDAVSYDIINIPMPTTPNGTARSDHLGMLGFLVIEDCTDGQSLVYQSSNTTWICVSGGNSIQGEKLAATWENDRAFTNIGTSFVDVYTATNSEGEAQRIDTTGMNKVTFQTLWSKLLGLGTQTCQIVDVTNSSNILITSDSLENGINTKATQDIPDSVKNTIKNYKPQCKSTTALDAPSWLGGQILLKP